MLDVNICGVDLKNPVIAASGTFGFGHEYMDFYDINRLGGICTKGLTLNPKEGNDGIRIWETSSGILNSVGLQNPGIDGFIEKEMPFLEKLHTAVIANLGGGCIEDYVKGAELLSSTSVDLIELNISCPNVKRGGMAFGIKSKDAREVVKEVRKACTKPLIVKLSPNAEDIVDMACCCENAGADAVSLVNTFKAMAIDINKRRAVFENVTAGLSGPAIKPIALRMVYEVSKAVHIPVIGLGGISSWRDAVEFIMAGAQALEIGTCNFVSPMSGVEIIDGLYKYMKDNKISKLEEIRGII